MNNVLKVILLLLAAVVAIKLLPLTFGIGCVLAAALLAMLALGASFIGVALVAVLFLAAVLSPIWIPVLILVGVIALIRRASRKTA